MSNLVNSHTNKIIENGCHTRMKMEPLSSCLSLSTRNQKRMKGQVIPLERSIKRNNLMMRSMTLINSNWRKARSLKRRIRRTL